MAIDPYSLPLIGAGGSFLAQKQTHDAEVNRFVNQHVEAGQIALQAEVDRSTNADNALSDRIDNIVATGPIVGVWDAGDGAFPTTRPNGDPIQKGDTWTVIGAGTVDGQNFAVGDYLQSIRNGGGATFSGNWSLAALGQIRQWALDAEAFSRMPFADRAAALAAIATASPTLGTVEWKTGQTVVGVVRRAGSTVIPDMPGWSPVGPYTPEHFGAVGDGVADDTAALAAAVGQALTAGTPLMAEGDYRTSASISDLHNIAWQGLGKVLRGDFDVWHVTPRGADLNVIWVGGANLTDNDGLSRDQPTNIARAFAIIRTIGAKALDGQWRIQLFGNLTSSGQAVPDLPLFRRALQIWGEADDLDSVPTTVWDGTSSVAANAMRFDWSNPSANVFLHFRNLKLTNWNSATNSAGLIVWASGNVLVENLHTDNCAIGDWFRQCVVRITHGRRDNAQTYGTSVQYGATGYIGNLQGGGLTMTNCAECVSVGRNTTAYIQGNDLSGDILVMNSRLARIRTQANTYRSWTNCVVYGLGVGVWTPDNGQGYPDTYIQTPTNDAPVFRCESGSVHTLIQRLSGNMHAQNRSGSLVTITGASGVDTALSGAPGATGGDFVPFRLPAWFLYSPSARLTVEMMMNLGANAGGVLSLRGAGPAAGLNLATFTIPAIASGRSGKVTLNFEIRPGSTTGRWTGKYESAQQTVFAIGDSVNLNQAAIRAPSEEPLLYRLYWQPADANSATFLGMRTYVDV